MNRAEFALAVKERDGFRCQWPIGGGELCPIQGPYNVEAAHLFHAGAGGSKEHDPKNGWTLCSRHHDIFDGRVTPKARREWCVLVAELLELRRLTAPYAIQGGSSSEETDVFARELIPVLNDVAEKALDEGYSVRKARR